MKDTLRCRIAFIIGSLPKSRGFDRPTRLYDYDTNKYIPMNIVYCNETYGLYDYNTKTYLYGNDSYMYDCETNEYLPMNIQFNDYGFNLYDYGRCSYANGNGKYIYDFATKQTVCYVL